MIMTSRRIQFATATKNRHTIAFALERASEIKYLLKQGTVQTNTESVQCISIANIN